MGSISKLGLKVKGVLTVASSEEDGQNDLVVHLDTEDVSHVIAELKKLGLSAEIRQR